MASIEYPLSVKNAVFMAEKLAAIKYEKGLLIHINKELESTERGDEESIYSIASDVCQWAKDEDGARDAIETRLAELYASKLFHIDDYNPEADPFLQLDARLKYIEENILKLEEKGGATVEELQEIASQIIDTREEWIKPNLPK